MRAFQARMTDEEYSKVGEMASAEGLSMSEYVRRKLFDSPGGMVFDVKGRRRRDKVPPLPEFTELAVPAKSAGKRFEDLTLSERLGFAEEMMGENLGENHD